MVAGAHLSLVTVLVLVRPGVSLLGQEPTPYRFMDDLEQSDGEAADLVSMKELATRPSHYHKRRIKVDGELTWNAKNARPSEIIYSLRDGGYAIRLILFPEAPLDPFPLLAHRVRVRGMFFDSSAEVDSARSWKERGRLVLYAEDIVEVSESAQPDSSAEEDSPDHELDHPDSSSATVASVLPRRGRHDISPESVFEVLFSHDMDASTFQGNVRLFEGTIGSDDVGPVDVELAYDASRRTLVVHPRRALGARMEIYLRLYRGIADTEGRPLSPEPQEGTELQSRRSAIEGGADLDALNAIVTIAFETRGY